MPWRVWHRTDFGPGWVPGSWFTVTDAAGLTFRLSASVRRCQVFAAFPVPGMFTILVECEGDSLTQEEEVARMLQESGYEPWCPVGTACLVRSRRAVLARLDEREEPAAQMELG